MNAEDQKQEIDHLMDRLQMAEETYKEKYIECEVLEGKLFKQKLGVYCFYYSVVIAPDPTSFSVLRYKTDSHTLILYFFSWCFYCTVYPSKVSILEYDVLNKCV